MWPKNVRLYEEAGSEGSGGSGSVGTTKTDAVSSAIAQIDKTFEKLGLESEGEETKPPVTNSEKSGDDKGENKNEDNLDEMEIKQARQLFAALKDPEKAPILLRFFADQAGLQKAETKTETKEVKDEILAALEENLGDEFSFLSGKLSKALDKIIAVKFEEHAKSIKETLQTQAHERLTTESATAYTDLSKQYFDKPELPENVSKEMSKLMDRYKPSQGTSVKEYLHDIFHMAASKLDLNLKTARNGSRVDKNRTDSISRLASDRGKADSTSDNSKTPITGDPKSMRNAIAAAKEAIDADFANKNK